MLERLKYVWYCLRCHLRGQSPINFYDWYYDDDYEFEGWLCTCGHWEDEWPGHCLSCGREPPWGCDCGECENDGERDEWLADWGEYPGELLATDIDFMKEQKGEGHASRI